MKKLECPECGNKLVHYKDKLICGKCGFEAKAKKVIFKIPVAELGLAVKSEA